MPKNREERAIDAALQGRDARSILRERILLKQNPERAKAIARLGRTAQYHGRVAASKAAKQAVEEQERQASLMRGRAEIAATEARRQQIDNINRIVKEAEEREKLAEASRPEPQYVQRVRRRSKPVMGRFGVQWVGFDEVYYEEAKQNG